MLVKKGKFRKYAVEISKNVYLEEDKSKNCQNYPNPDFGSYKECDEQYMRDICNSFNLAPIWLYDDFLVKMGPGYEKFELTICAASCRSIPSSSARVCTFFRGASRFPPRRERETLPRKVNCRFSHFAWILECKTVFVARCPNRAGITIVMNSTFSLLLSLRTHWICSGLILTL